MNLTVDEVMSKLEEMGTEQTKHTFLRHGAVEPLFGVKVGDMKKLVKDVKKIRVWQGLCIRQAITMQCIWLG